MKICRQRRDTWIRCQVQGKQFQVSCAFREVQTQPSLSPRDLASKLNETFSPKRIQFSTQQADESEDEDMPSEDEQDKQKQFVQKRKQHYNEFLMVKQMRQQLQNDGDDEEDAMQE